MKKVDNKKKRPTKEREGKGIEVTNLKTLPDSRPSQTKKPKDPSAIKGPILFKHPKKEDTHFNEQKC